MQEIERAVWDTHERRLNEHENHFNNTTKDFTEIKDALKQLSERLNEGVSKTQQKLLDENKNIELSIQDLKHAFEINSINTKKNIDDVEFSLNKRVSTLEDSEKKNDRIWWAIVAAFIVVIVGFVGSQFLSHMWPKDRVQNPLQPYAEQKHK